MESLRESEDGCADNDPTASDDLPFVVASKRITIEWPVSLLRSLQITNFGGGCSHKDSPRSSELSLEDIEISSVFCDNREGETSQDRDWSRISQEVQRVEAEICLQEKEMASIKLKYMQIYMMGGYAWKHFYDSKQSKYSFWIEIKNQKDQIIKSINILDEGSGREQVPVRRSPPPPRLWSSPSKSNFEYSRFASSQIHSSRRAFQLNTNQYKIQLFKILNLKISVRCDDVVHLVLTNGSSSSSGTSSSTTESGKAVAFPITRQNLSRLARHGGFQILLELKDGLRSNSEQVSHCGDIPGTRVGYVLLTVQRDHPPRP